MKLLDRWSADLLSVFRIVAGLLFLEHGTAKLLHFPEVAMFDHLKLVSLLGMAGVIELVGGVLITLGLFARVAAFIAAGEMAAAYFIYHLPHGGFFPMLNGGEAAILFCFSFLFVAAAGPGPWSVDFARKHEYPHLHPDADG